DQWCNLRIGHRVTVALWWLLSALAFGPLWKLRSKGSILGSRGWTTFSKAASPKAPESSWREERAAGRQFAADNTSTKEPQSSANQESTSAPKNHPPSSKRTCYDSAGTSRN